MLRADLFNCKTPPAAVRRRWRCQWESCLCSATALLRASRKAWPPFGDRESGEVGKGLKRYEGATDSLLFVNLGIRIPLLAFARCELRAVPLDAGGLRTGRTASMWLDSSLRRRSLK